MNDLERRIIAARPLSGHRSLPLSDRAKRELAELVVADTLVPGAPRPAHRRRLRARRPLLMLAAAAIAMLVVLSSTTLLRPTQTWAATPPLLTATPVAGTAAQLLNRLANAAAASDDPTPTGDIHISLQEWSLDIEEQDDRTFTTTVEPQEYSIDRRANGSWKTVVTAAPPFEYPDSAAPNGDTPAPGTVLWHDEYLPGEYKPAFPIPFPTMADEVGAYFEHVFGREAILDADAAFLNLPLLLMEQVLGGRERAAALRYLAALPGIDVVGKVTDRLGRAGIMFRAARTGDPNTLDYLVIAPRDGKILAAETHYVGHTRSDIRSPSVMSYSAWK